MLDTYLSPKPGFQRQSSPIARRQFPHGGGYRLDALDFEDDSRGWRFDMDMVIIYIYSVNWIIGFFIFCFLCYIFFPSFWQSWQQWRRHIEKGKVEDTEEWSYNK